MTSKVPMLTALTLLAGVMFSPMAIAQDVYEDAYVARSGVIRAGPDYDFPKVRSVSSGRVIQVFGCIQGYEWCDVEYRGSRGWFPGDNIAFDYDGRRAPLRWVAPLLGLMILDFAIDDYWHNHYYDRPWYERRTIWFDWRPREPRNFPPPPPPSDWPKKKLLPPPPPPPPPVGRAPKGDPLPPPPAGIAPKLAPTPHVAPPAGTPVKPPKKPKKYCPPGQVCEQ